MFKVKVPSIHCMSCVRNIDDALKESDAKGEVSAEMSSKTLTVKTSLAESEVKRIIEGAGFPVVDISTNS